jgi:Na+/proline symporter
MQTGLLHLHNFLRWVILVLLLLSIIKAYSGWRNKKTFSAGDGKLWLFTMVSAHITLLLGLYQVAFGRFGFLTTELPEGTSPMKDSFYRFFWIEHPVSMIAAIVFITLGRRMAKSAASDETKYRKAFWFFLVALLLILVAIPWPFAGEPIARPLFPGMKQ